MPLLSSPAEQQRPESLRGTYLRGKWPETWEAKCSDRLTIGSVKCARTLEPKIEDKEGGKRSTGPKGGMMKLPGRDRRKRAGSNPAEIPQKRRLSSLRVLIGRYFTLRKRIELRTGLRFIRIRQALDSVAHSG